MAPVRRLDETLVNRIAAGEVVERPASVVKELLENAIDAGSGRVVVELEDAGKRLVRVSDDGEGMLREDAVLALERHATSKLGCLEDLLAIRTLGFRGEALPAIAAVSRFELSTAARGAEGVRIRLEGGGAPAVDAVARAPGTTVTARDLFFSTPARRKFLKTDATELRRTIDAVVQPALAHPRVAFELRSGGRRVLRLPGASSAQARLAALYGAEYAEELVPLSSRAGDLALEGWIQRPSAAARGARRQLLFVNGRPVQDRALVAAALRGYVSTLAGDVQPHLFLFLEVPPDQVDVNVHPAKREVRFRDADAVFGFVHAAVRRTLGGLDSAVGLRRPRGLRRVAGGNGGAGGAAPGGGREAAAASAPSEDQLGFFLNARLRSGSGDEQAPEPAARTPRLWQLHDTFILAQTGSGLAVIDQHSAHERVLYEALVAAFEREAPPAQELVFPRTYRLGPAEWSALEENRGLLERLGFHFEAFGERTVALRAVPNLGSRFQPEAAFVEALEELADRPAGVGSQHRRVAQALACHGAIKAGEPLDPEEMERLFRDLVATDHPAADVHGRPAVVQIPLEDLRRRFERG